MILLCQVFIFQLLSGLCGGFGWLGHSSYTTSRPRTVEPHRPVLYENPVAEGFGYQSYKPSQQIYTTKKSVVQPYQSFFHQGYTTTKPKPITKNPTSTTMTLKPTTKKPKQVVFDPLVMYPSPASQIHEYQSHGSFEPSQQPDAKPHAVHTEDGNVVQIDPDHGELAAYTRQPVGVSTTGHTTSRGFYEVTSRPAAYMRQPVEITTTRPATSRGSYEVTTRRVASQYEPVTDLPKPTPGYETLTGGSFSEVVHSDIMAMYSDSSSFTLVEMYEPVTGGVTTPSQQGYETLTSGLTPGIDHSDSMAMTMEANITMLEIYWYSSKEDISDYTEEPEDPFYEVATRPDAYTRLPVGITTRPTTSKQYEPVTDVPKPTPGYETLVGGSISDVDHSDIMAMNFDSSSFTLVEMYEPVTGGVNTPPTHGYETLTSGSTPGIDHSDIMAMSSESSRFTLVEMYEPVIGVTTPSSQDYETLTRGSTHGMDNSDIMAMNSESSRFTLVEMYEPVTGGVTTPSSQGYETLTSGSTLGIDHSDIIAMNSESSRFTLVEMYEPVTGVTTPSTKGYETHTSGSTHGIDHIDSMAMGMEVNISMLEVYWYSSNEDISDNTEEPEDPFYEVTTIPAAYMRQPVEITTTRPTTSRGSYEVATRQVAPQYEPVTPSTHDYAALESGLLPYYRYSASNFSKQDDLENTEEPDDDASSSQTSSTSPLSVLGLPDYKPALSSGFMERSFPGTGKSPPFCHSEERVEFVDQCETYKEETCNTLNKEKCSSRVLSNCRPVLRTRVEEVCMNVTNKVCTLVESEKRVKEEEVIFISSCSRVMEQVCDQSYKMEVTDQEQELCVDLESVNCIQEKITVSDTICVDGVEFNCQQDGYMEKTACEKIVKENCTSTPKEVMVTSCKPTSTLCHNLTSQQAVPTMIEVCRDQPTAVCRLVEEVRPLERKVYTYSVSCNMKEQEECKLVEKKKLETSCSEQDRPVCEHHLGEEECVEEDKEFCHQVEKVVEVEVCDDEFQTYEI